MKNHDHGQQKSLQLLHSVFSKHRFSIFIGYILHYILLYS